MPGWLVILVALASAAVLAPYVMALLVVVGAEILGALGAAADRIGRRRIDHAYAERDEDEDSGESGGGVPGA